MKWGNAPEQCAARMTAFLAKKPRGAKTRAYLATLPRRKQVVVTPDSFPPSREEKQRQLDAARAAAKHVIDRAMMGINIEPIHVPKIRKRPKARTKWLCRPNGRSMREGITMGRRVIRDKDTCDADRIALHGAQEGLCALCAGSLDEDPRRDSLDHVIPIFDGGSDGRGNIVLCHKECNGAKSNDVPTGCELVWLLAVNARLGVLPVTW